MPLASPTWRVLQRLFENADRDPQGLIRVYLDLEHMFAHLNPDQRANAERACPTGISNLDCWNDLARTAARQVWAEFEVACPAADGKHVCTDSVINRVNPRLDSAGFTEPGGAVGPAMPDGELGRMGQMAFGVAP